LDRLGNFIGLNFSMTMLFTSPGEKKVLVKEKVMLRKGGARTATISRGLSNERARRGGEETIGRERTE